MTGTKQQAKGISFPSAALRGAMEKYLRFQLVVGAKAGAHTGTMRGATPNCILIEPG
jgi:hypothetical protein